VYKAEEIDSLAAPPGYVSLCQGKVIAREDSLAGLSNLDTIIFDLDGVIFDPSESIMSAHPIATQLWLEQFRGLVQCDRLVSAMDVAELKLAGGFNDDWNIASAIALFYSVMACYHKTADGHSLLRIAPSLSDCARGSAGYGGGIAGVREWLRGCAGFDEFTEGESLWDGAQAARVFMEVVSGPHCNEMYGFSAETYSGQGAIVNDKLLVDVRTLDLPYRQAVFSGRTLGEIHVGFRLTGLDGWITDERIISVDDGMPKPHGKPIQILADRLGTKTGAFVGDNPDDFRSVVLYRHLDDRPFYAISVIFGVLQEESRETFVGLGSDMIAPDLRFVAQALRELKR